MRTVSYAALLTVFAASTGAQSADAWPTYRHDNQRSGFSRATVAFPLKALWTHEPQHAPAPAWGGPAKRDAYNKVENMRMRLGFDRAFHTTIADGRVFFASSADDQVHCLDINTGKELWTFFAEAPIRFAPTLWQTGIYFGSDDGHAYCVDAKTGAQVWRVRPGPKDYRVPGNGRMMSAWPIRTGVVIQDEIAYCCAGLFPDAGSYLCAIKASNGDVLWTKKAKDIHAQGYMLASKTKLYIPGGSGRPTVFSRRDGQVLRTLGGGGGTFCVLDGDSLIYGPGKTGQLGQFASKEFANEQDAKRQVKSGDQIATYAGQHMILADVAYLHNDREITCLNRRDYIRFTQDKRQLQRELAAIRKQLDPKRKPSKSTSSALQSKIVEIGKQTLTLDRQLRECVVWRRSCDFTLDMILTATALITGGEDQVVAYAIRDGKELWRAEVKGNAYGLAAANGKLFVSTDKGSIHCFSATAETTR